MNSSIQRFSIAAVVVLFLASAAAAQLTPGLSGPVVGFIFDSNTLKLRPVTGILGSATVGKPIETGFAISQVLTLDANHFIASTAASPQLLTLSLEARQLSATPLPGAALNPLHAAASLHGTAAAFYYADSQRIALVTGLPEKPAASPPIDFSRFGRPLKRMAVSDDGAFLVFTVDEEGSEALYGWTASGDSPRFLATAVSISALTITDNATAIAADRGADEVFAIRNADGPAFRQFLAGAREGVSSPAGVTVGNNNRIYIGNAGSATVVVLDSNGHYLGTHQCGCELSGLYPLRDSVFRLTDRVDRTVFLLDAGSTEERILFVPPAED